MIEGILETTGNYLLQFDPETRRKLSSLDGKVIRLDIRVIGLELFFIPNQEGVQIKSAWSGPVDITLRGTPLAFAQFGLKQQGVDNQMFIDKRVTIEGDAELAQDFQKLIRELDIDLEELTSRYVGDIAAHQIGRGAREIRAWTKDTVQSFRLNIRDYMVEESRLLVPSWRVDDFIERTDVLRADVERLEQRVKRIRSLIS
ncbi:MAG: SCP2 sterol-binding domain-containing protein [Arenicellales bacterium]|nr:SCP2 sterol-binding domain-containing protein [Arenicellales bacterium]